MTVGKRDRSVTFGITRLSVGVTIDLIGSFPVGQCSNPSTSGQNWSVAVGVGGHCSQKLVGITGGWWVGAVIPEEPEVTDPKRSEVAEVSPELVEFAASGLEGVALDSSVTELETCKVVEVSPELVEFVDGRLEDVALDGSVTELEILEVSDAAVVPLLRSAGSLGLSDGLEMPVVPGIWLVKSDVPVEV